MNSNLMALSQLRSASRGSSALSAAVAEALGYRKDQMAIDAGAKKNWVAPSGGDFVELPHFTTSLDAVCSLRTVLGESTTISFSWEKSQATAKIADGPFIVASTPELAICMAAVHYQMRRQQI
ncbi:hypothetical protein [Neorhizobium sp. NCHU2750]|uniref:hypothetical protein n=1 Tax=Neorhizobium sp. NCHU2750 TaxID=1825976 RepID=UPI000E7143EF|nr:hypothetical protein NCHU2750_01940 [Neorhizobium sp. NCHU2750]